MCIYFCLDILIATTLTIETGTKTPCEGYTEIILVIVALEGCVDRYVELSVRCQSRAGFKEGFLPILWYIYYGINDGGDVQEKGLWLLSREQRVAVSMSQR